MLGYLLPVTAFFATIILIVVLRPVAMRMGLTDAPGGRKAHQGEMPLVGGIAIFIAVMLCILLRLLFLDQTPEQTTYLLSFSMGALLLVVVGAWDDWRGLSPLVRFGLQIVAGIIMVYGGGIFLTDLGYLTFSGEVFSLGDLAVPFTVFVVVGMINAINMCDGLDGLSGNMTLVSLAGLGIANSIWGGSTHLILLNSISAAVAGFLVFNQRNFWRNKAWVFLGDAGSMMLGFALIWSAVEISRAYPPILSPAATVWFLAIPVFDTVTMMIRRVTAGRSPFQADAEHLHHLFVRAGFTTGETIGIICFLAAAGCGVGLGVTYLKLSDLTVAGMFLFTGLFYLWLIQSSWKKGIFLNRPLR